VAAEADRLRCSHDVDQAQIARAIREGERVLVGARQQVLRVRRRGVEVAADSDDPAVTAWAEDVCRWIAGRCGLRVVSRLADEDPAALVRHSAEASAHAAALVRETVVASADGVIDEAERAALSAGVRPAREALERVENVLRLPTRRPA
jgi:hypothetical protein